MGLIHIDLFTPQGVVYVRYARTEGVPATGDMTSPDRALDTPPSDR